MVRARLQLFFHKFFLNKIDKQTERAKKVAKRKKGGADDSDDNDDASGNDVASHTDPVSDEEESSDDAEEAEIWKVRIPRICWMRTLLTFRFFRQGHETHNARSTSRPRRNG
jgi:hypothetical protein